MAVHVEADDKGAADWPLQVDAEEETPEQLTASGMQQRPGCCDVSARFFLKDSREIEHVAPSARLNPEPDCQSLLRISVEDRRGYARQSLTRQLLESAYETLGRKVREVLDDARHVTAPVASFLS
jgi:hypothetical protein